ncbi:hypothetical protein T439DRAFT_227628 [Meredithblackwellia eburnea MCA 4105]
MVYIGLFSLSLGQAFDYYNWYFDDPWVLKGMVAWVMANMLCHGVFMWRIIWYKAITGWGDISAISHTTIEEQLPNFTTTFIVVPTQIFFASVAWKLVGKNIYFLILMGFGIASVLFCGLGMIWLTCIKRYGWSQIPKPLPQTWLWSMCAVDITTAGVLCVRFRQMQQNAGEKSRALLWRFLFLAVRTSSVTTAVVILERIWDKTGNGLLGAAPGFLLAGVSLTSFLHTLVSRKQLQIKHNSTNLHHSDDKHFNGGNVRGRTVISGIRVETIVLRDVDNSEKLNQPPSQIPANGESGGPKLQRPEGTYHV